MARHRHFPALPLGKNKKTLTFSGFNSLWTHILYFRPLKPNKKLLKMMTSKDSWLGFLGFLSNSDALFSLEALGKFSFRHE